MIAIIEEAAQYSDYSTYSIDKLPEEWEDMPQEDQANWLIQNGKYQQTESVFDSSAGILNIEIEEEA
jgi:hypothetical protein